MYSNYPPNRDCVWRIYAPDGYRVKLHFTSFGLEGGRNCPFDYVTIFDGPTATGREIVSACGNHIPADVTSKSNVLYVSFHSDQGNADIGFNATYTIVKQSKYLLINKVSVVQVMLVVLFKV